MDIVSTMESSVDAVITELSKYRRVKMCLGGYYDWEEEEEELERAELAERAAAASELREANEMKEARERKAWSKLMRSQRTKAAWDQAQARTKELKPKYQKFNEELL